MGFTRSKRVTDPLADEVRARLVGCSFSSGSEHSGDGIDADDSPCLSDLVDGFLEDHGAEIGGESSRWCENDSGSDSDSDSERVCSAAERPDVAEEISRSLRNCLRDDPYGRALLAHVARAMEVLSSLDSHHEHHAVLHRNVVSSLGSDHDRRAVFRRKVMSLLRELGHNAAICKTKWSTAGNLTGGNHEFIDVVAQSPGATAARYVVDLEFAPQFEIARPTAQYARVLQALPRVFVGRGEDLKLIVRLASDAARRSLRSRGLTVPPWRKNRYMQTRWLGPYKRTTNLTPSSNGVNSVLCRAVGFDNAVGGRLFVRTR